MRILTPHVPKPMMEEMKAGEPTSPHVYDFGQFGDIGRTLSRTTPSLL